MEGFNFNSGILNAEELDNLFMEDDNSEQEKQQERQPDNSGEGKENEEITEVNSEDLFDEVKPESVGNRENKEGKENSSSSEEGTSPNFYSSIANALVEEGVLSDFDVDALAKVQDATGLRDLIEQSIQSRFDEKQRRIDNALNAGVEVSDIQKYENAINYLDSITDDMLKGESERNEQIRRELIFRNYLNKGLSQEKAKKLTEDSFKLGNDIEDAREALVDNKKFFNDNYNMLIKEAQDAEEQVRKERVKMADELKNAILKDDKVFGSFDVDNATRKRIYENLSKPVWKDPETGNLLTAIQKYEKENKNEFLKNLAFAFTMTNGFTDWSGMVKGPVNKEVKKGLRELEKTLNNTSRSHSGNLKFVNSAKEDPESFIGTGFTLDI